VPIDKTKPPIEARGIRSQFGPNIVHEDLNFTVKRGEIVGLVGGSGTGKSVLMNTLLGLKEPEAGVIRYFGQNRRDLSPMERRDINNEMGDFKAEPCFHR